MYNVQAEKQQLSPEHITVVIDFIVMLIGQQLTEQDLRKVFREGNFAGIAQSDLSPLLREMRDSFKTSPAARLTDLAVLLPKEISLPILALAENTHQMLMRTKHAAKNDVAEEMRTLQAEHDLKCKSLRDEIKSITEEYNRASQYLEAANETNRTLLERINQLDREKTLLEGRLQERAETAKAAKAVKDGKDGKDGKAKLRKNGLAAVPNPDQADSATEVNAATA
jgi:hypothetical protein